MRMIASATDFVHMFESQVTAEAYWYMVNPAGILDELKESMAGCSSGRGSRSSSSIWTGRGIGN